MRRKMKLIYRLLELAEASNSPMPVPEIDGYSDQQVQYHVGLCSQARYLEVDGPVQRLNEQPQYLSMQRLILS